MANAFTFYTKAVRKMISNIIDIDDDTIKAMLVDNTFVQDPDDEFVADVVADEVSGTGYAGGFGGAGRLTLTGATWLDDLVNNWTTLSFDTLEWAGIDAGDILGLIVIKEITNDSDSLVIGYSAFDGGAYTSSGNTLSVDCSPLMRFFRDNPA